MDSDPADPVGDPQPARLAETHVSVVTMIGDRAYKLLKPVATGVVDHRAREDRRESCRREVEAGRRFAPDVYLGVLDVLGPRGEPLDHLIAMRRLPAGRALSSLLEGPGAVWHVGEAARAVATLHRIAPRSRSIDEAGHPAAMLARWEDGAGRLALAAPGLLEPDEIERVAGLARRYVEGRTRLFERRIAQGWIRDGHGGLAAGDLYLLPDGPRVLGCPAWDGRLRHADVLLDVARLAMDIATRGMAGLAQRLLDDWAEALDEEHPRSLGDHHMAHRAHAGAVVAAQRGELGDPAGAAGARHLHRYAATMIERAQVRLVLVGGAPGTGKSTVAAGLGHLTGSRVVRADIVRRGLAAAAADAAGRRGGRDGHNLAEPVHRRVLERAGELLALGEDVVLDAAWSSATQREDARRLAARQGARMVELRCEVSGEVAARRAAGRPGRGGGPAQAGEVAARRPPRADPWPQALALPTDAAPDEVCASAARAMGIGPLPG